MSNDVIYIIISIFTLIIMPAIVVLILIALDGQYKKSIK